MHTHPRKAGLLSNEVLIIRLVHVPDKEEIKHDY